MEKLGGGKDGPASITSLSSLPTSMDMIPSSLQFQGALRCGRASSL